MSYSGCSNRELERSESEILARKFDSLYEIDTAFFGAGYQRGDDQRDKRIKAWIESEVVNQKMQRKKRPLRSLFVGFPRQHFKTELAQRYGSMTALLIVYYLCVAIWWWRNHKGV